MGILLFDGVQIIDFAAPYEVFGQADFAVETFSIDGKSITTAMDMTVQPDVSLEKADGYDVILVPGGNIGEAAQNPRIQSWLQQQVQQSEHVLSVCTGSFILGEAGLLNDLTATSFHRAWEAMAQQFPTTTIVRDQRWVDNGKIVTSAGLSSGIDAALHIVAKIKGMDTARTVAMHLEYDFSPQQGFVRGRMADRLLQHGQINWPDDMQVQRMVAFGDENSWLARYAFTSQMEDDEVLQNIADGYRQTDDWSLHQQSGEHIVLQHLLGSRRKVCLRYRIAPYKTEQNAIHIDLNTIAPGDACDF